VKRADGERLAPRADVDVRVLGRRAVPKVAMAAID
jgi:hypothetical protein